MLDSGCALDFRRYYNILQFIKIYCCNIQYIVAIYNILLQYTIYCNILQYVHIAIAIIAIYESSILQYILSSWRTATIYWQYTVPHPCYYIYYIIIYIIIYILNTTTTTTTTNNRVKILIKYKI